MGRALIMGRYLKVASGLAAIVLLAEAAPVAAGAQAAATALGADVVAGDSLYALRKVDDALAHYLRAITANASDFAALIRASRAEVDLAERVKGGPMDSLLTSGQQHAEAAIKLKPDDAEGHFALARALGRRALSVGVMDRIRFSKVIRAEALASLKADSTHAGALHVLGMWNAEIMRVNGMARMFARTFLGAQVFSLANWDEAQRLLEAAVRVDPKRMVHHLDLGKILADRGMTDKAREQFNWIAAAPIVEPNDDLYKKQAADRLQRL
jgi:tetratricopeptide (TPR) repeat protein